MTDVENLYPAVTRRGAWQCRWALNKSRSLGLVPFRGGIAHVREMHGTRQKDRALRKDRGVDHGSTHDRSDQDADRRIANPKGRPASLRRPQLPFAESTEPRW